MATNGTPERSNDAPQGSQPSGGGGFAISGKMLGIAGGGAAALVVVIVVVVLLVTGVLGGGGGGGASGGRDILAYIPGDAGLVIIGDNRAVVNGNIPEDLIEHLEDDEADGALDDFPDSFDDLDIDDDDVATLAFVGDEDQNDSLVIVQGDFEFDIVREELEDGADCEGDDYRGFELWECPDGGAVALFEKDGYLVFAAERRQDDLERLLTYKSRTPEKLADADDSDIKEILSRTDGGWLQLVYILEDCVIERCEGLAIALGESDDSDAIPTSYAVMFSSERAAAASEGDVAIDDVVEEILAGFNLELDIGEVKSEGEFVVGSGTAEFVEPESGSSRSSEPSRDVANRDATVSDPNVINWINYCYETGSVSVGVGECQCLYDYLQSNLRGGQIPRFSASWEVGYGSETEIDAMNACGMNVRRQTTGESAPAATVWPTNTPVPVP